MSASALASLTKSIDSDIQKLESSMTPALTGAVPLGFFALKATEVLPVVAKAKTAKNLIPPPGTSGLVKRCQFAIIEDKLQEFSTDNFPFLEAKLQIYLNPLTEAVAKAEALSSIVAKIPGIIADFVILKNEMRKVKKALRV